MLEKITYINHIGEKVEFGVKGTYANANTLRDYMWTHTSTTSGISFAMNQDVQEKVLPIVIVCDTELEGVTLKNKLFEVFEKDVLEDVAGRIYVGEYYLECYVVGCKKTDYLRSKRIYSAELSILPERMHWCRENKQCFYASIEQTIDAAKNDTISDILDNISLKVDNPWDYPHEFLTKYKPAKRRYIRDYPYDYYRDHTVGKLDNDHFAASHFKITIYGSCMHPEIRIAGNIYKVSTTLYDNEYMVIDSRARTIVKHGRNGVQTNLFNARDKINYIFQKIPPGKSTVRWNALYPFDVVLYQERSEPLWTM